MYTRFPKLESPFVRTETGSGEYLVTNSIASGYEWVFENSDVDAVEKLDGENIAVFINESGSVESIYTREGIEVAPFADPTKSYIIKGVLDAYQRGWVEMLESGELHYGELVGPKCHGNKYDLSEHMWVPFEYARENLTFESWGEYAKTYEAISSWFRDSLIPLFYSRIHNIPFDELSDSAYVEGVIFTHPNGQMAKIRRNMFDWYGENDV
jgi:hypothetical protein